MNRMVSRIKQGGLWWSFFHTVVVLLIFGMFIWSLTSPGPQRFNSSYGHARKVNMQKLEEKIYNRHLSTHKALFFKVIEE